MIELKTENYYIGCWRANTEGRKGDWMCMAWREPDGIWHIKYRFRYHQDDRHFESKDDRKWYHMTMKKEHSQLKTDEEMEAKVKEACDMLVGAGILTGNFSNPTYLDCRGDGKKMIELMQQSEPGSGWAWATMPKEQGEEYLKTLKVPPGVKVHGDTNKEGL